MVAVNPNDVEHAPIAEAHHRALAVEPEREKHNFVRDVSWFGNLWIDLFAPASVLGGELQVKPRSLGELPKRIRQGALFFVCAILNAKPNCEMTKAERGRLSVVVDWRRG